jgi:hypothetical protein
VPMEEIVATVRAVRRGRRSREAGH